MSVIPPVITSYSIHYTKLYDIFDLDGSVFTGDEISVSGSYEVHGFNANNTTSTPDAKGSIELTVNPLPTIDLENQTAIFESPYLIINNSTDIGVITSYSIHYTKLYEKFGC